MSVELTAKLTFICTRAEQAEYIERLLIDLQSLIECGSSYIETTIAETTRV